MTYREQQRQKVTSIREAFFKDPGNGIFYGKEREFALSDPIINLWKGIRYDAVDYFKRNNIGWWQSSGVAALYFEPFYQLMRQTLFGSQSVKVKDYGISSYKHLHVAPMQNTELREKITSNGLNGADIHDAWIKTLKEKDAFIGTSPENLLRPVSNMRDTKSFLHYIENRYWK